MPGMAPQNEIELDVSIKNDEKFMKRQHEHLTASALLRRSPISPTDAARIATECIEELGERTRGLSRRDLLLLMRRCIREGCEAIAAGENTVTFEEAARLSIAARSDRRPTTLRDLRHFVRRMLRVEGIATLPLRKMTSADCRRILNSEFASSPSSYNKARIILHGIFAFGIRQEWVDANPVKRIDSPRITEKTIRPLSVKQIRRLWNSTERPEHAPMRLSLHLMLYCGLRPTEVQRLSTSDINWKEQTITIRTTTSKTGGGRIVPLRGAQHLRRTDRCIPRNWITRWKKLRCAAGFAHSWVPDICRHTFASYHAAHFRNLSELQLEMGHRDTTLLRTRYVTATSPHQAKIFWGAR